MCRILQQKNVFVNRVVSWAKLYGMHLDQWYNAEGYTFTTLRFLLIRKRTLSCLCVIVYMSECPLLLFYTHTHIYILHKLPQNACIACNNPRRWNLLLYGLWLLIRAVTLKLYCVFQGCINNTERSIPTKTKSSRNTSANVWKRYNANYWMSSSSCSYCQSRKYYTGWSSGTQIAHLFAQIDVIQNSCTCVLSLCRESFEFENIGCWKKIMQVITCWLSYTG